MNNVILVPIGEVEGDVIVWVAEAIREHFGLSATISASLDIPLGSYDSARDQYLSAPFLRALKEKISPKALRVLGITGVDLYAPPLNFIFGQADLDGQVAVVSICRLKESFYGRPKDSELLRSRVIKEAVHELGHTFGLEHCPDPRCVMHFSNSLAETDRKGEDFCSRHLRQMNETLQRY